MKPGIKFTYIYILINHSTVSLLFPNTSLFIRNIPASKCYIQGHVPVYSAHYIYKTTMQTHAFIWTYSVYYSIRVLGSSDPHVHLSTKKKNRVSEYLRAAVMTR